MSEAAAKALPGEDAEAICRILAQDPRPGYQDDPAREYKMDYDGYNVTFTVQSGAAFVKKIQKIE